MLLMFFSSFSFQRLSPRSLRRSSLITPNFDTCFMMTRIHKIGSEISRPYSKNGRPKHQNLDPLSANFATWSRISPEWNQVMVRGKTALQKLRSLLRVRRLRTKFSELWSTHGEKQERNFDRPNTLIASNSRLLFIMNRGLHYTPRVEIYSGIALFPGNSATFRFIVIFRFYLIENARRINEQILHMKDHDILPAQSSIAKGIIFSGVCL